MVFFDSVRCVRFCANISSVLLREIEKAADAASDAIRYGIAVSVRTEIKCPLWDVELIAWPYPQKNFFVLRWKH